MSRGSAKTDESLKWMKLMSFRSLLVSSMPLSVFLIVYGEWQDAHMEVRYTDVDYIVFSDAASLMASGESPYKRTTYRYSPLLALLLIPNTIFLQSWGKFLSLLLGTSRFLLTLIPHFRKVLISAFGSPHCGERNNDFQFVGEIQPQGCCYHLEVLAGDEKIFDRQVVKYESATIKVLVFWKSLTLRPIESVGIVWRDLGDNGQLK